jgi:hypothetical protein
MPRFIRNTVITAKIETTVGTDAAPVGTDAVLVSDLQPLQLDAQNVDRNLYRGFFGGSEQLVATMFKRLSFSVELAGAAAAATVPAWDALMQACGFAVASLATPSRVEYTPISSNLKSCTIYYYDDGVLHKMVGCYGNWSLDAPVQGIPKIRFDFVGIDGGDSATANVTPTLTQWKKPVTMVKANLVDMTAGAAYSAGTLTGGTTYPSQGLSLDGGNVVNFTPLCSQEAIDLSDRSVQGKVVFDLTAAQEVSNLALVKSNATTAYGFTIGTVTGNKILIHMPAVQLVNPSKAEVNGRRLIGYDLRVVPVAGNDEIRIASV